MLQCRLDKDNIYVLQSVYWLYMDDVYVLQPVYRALQEKVLFLCQTGLEG